ncbi:rRNA-binding ribosome biosynthesis protein [Coemansia sp. RSA 353]|nr:rRNA-binding ribosome biosynthesis protein [Coemansia sp. RSA 1591]KAJ1757852.1 rRNA-binding ribosome biosynthesis protein [Coemansia sp. RSA 1752]KAJ1784779.1 rRNA-binding ribosome biosynthesis protein [Coemansia sp. RSA 1938]KAJ1793525.1 rRNA-binding ribosome biosynthesis protein [Coemansia sp. RSA 2167]KAJ2140416.1 rRNA-binding ribosome biosynthesis protein [Coemansia sp. RSA 564]KAJ2154417.1 rRNA-binding ribosome biosynthesis protein [Coemansia sp. RSA 637]KAJ2166795.1 rRNA-binding rib
MGHGRKKKRTHAVPTQEEFDDIPKTLVVRSGTVGRSVSALVSDVRQVMQPHTAVKLRERASNKIKDYVAVSNHLGLTHMLLFSQTETGTNLRISRFPRGPTLYMRVEKYALAKDCLRLQKTPHTSAAEFLTPPLIILNNFAGENKGREFKLMTTMLQNMFPAINPSTMRLTDARRVVLFNYNEETGLVDFRHYAVVVKPVGVTKGVKRVILSKNMPSLAQFDDISDYVLREAFASESDVEDGPENSVTLAQDYVGRNNAKNEQRAIRLLELGPRMDLRLMKIEAGLCEGEVIYHNYISKTKEELAEAEHQRQINLTNQARRRQQQDENVKRKKAKKGANNSDSEDDASEEDVRAPKIPEQPHRSAKDDFGGDAYNEDLFEDSESDASMDNEDANDSDADAAPAPKRAKPTKKK